MNKFLACTILLAIGVTGATAASAAGITAPSSAYEWGGFYGGVDLGVAGGQMRATDITQPLGGYFTDSVPAGTEGFSFSNTNVAAGVHAGAQYQWQQIVFGAEASWAASALKQTIESPYFPGEDTETGTINQFATAVGRIGYSFDRFMLYAKAGYAGGSVDFQARDHDTFYTYRQNTWQSGFAVGAGLDYAISDSLSLGVDYTHLDLGSAQSTGPNVRDDGVLGANPETYRTAATADVIMARVSYHFAPN